MNMRDELIKTWVAANQASKLSQLFDRYIGHLPDSPLESIFQNDFKNIKVKEIFNNDLSTLFADVVARNMKEHFAEEVKVEVNEALDLGQSKADIEVKLQKKIQVFSELLKTAKEILTYEKSQELTRTGCERSLKQFIQLTEIALEPYLTRDKKGLENLPQEIMSGYTAFYHALELKSEQEPDLYHKYQKRLDELADDNCFAKWADSDNPVESGLFEKVNKLFVRDCSNYLLKVRNTSELNVFFLEKQFENALSRIAGFHSLMKDINEVIFSAKHPDRGAIKAMAHNLTVKLTAACRNFVKDPYGEGQQVMADLTGCMDVLIDEIKKIRVDQAALEAEKQAICWACFMKAKITDLTGRIHEKKQAAQNLQETFFDLKAVIEKYPQFQTTKITPAADLTKPPAKHRRDMSYSSMNLDRVSSKDENKNTLKRVKSKRSLGAKVMPAVLEEDASLVKSKKAW